MVSYLKNIHRLSSKTKFFILNILFYLIYMHKLKVNANVYLLL